MKPHRLSHRRTATSLPDVLIATMIVAMGVTAATNLSLSMTTQEDISWRVNRGLVMTENAASLFLLGLEPAMALSLLPTDPLVTIVAQNEADQPVDGDLSFRKVEIETSVTTTDDLGSWTEGTWTGGAEGAAAKIRTFSVTVFRSGHQLRMDQ